MKIDWNLNREILFEIESWDYSSKKDLIYSTNKKSGTEEFTKLYHAKYLHEKGLVKCPNGFPVKFLNGDEQIIISDLTAQGHDFLAEIRDNKIWHKIIKKAQEIGVGLTIDRIKTLATEVLNTLLKT